MWGLIRIVQVIKRLISIKLIKIMIHIWIGYNLSLLSNGFSIVILVQGRIRVLEQESVIN